MILKPYRLLRGRDWWSFLLTSLLFLVLLSATPVLAWDQALIKAANAVALGKGHYSERQLVMVLSNNYDINLLAMKGKIKDGVFQTCQQEFVEFSIESGRKAAKEAGVSFTVQARKPSDKIEPFKAGTDSDYLTGATTPEEVQLMKNTYEDDITQRLKDLDKEYIPDRTDWSTKNDIDFMGDADSPKMTDKNFEAIAKLNNAAYKRPGAARYEAFSRGHGKFRIQDSIDYMDEMQDMIKHRDSFLELHMNEHDKLLLELQNMPEGSAADVKWRRIEYLDTEMFKNRALQAKYMDRINLATENLRKTLPDDSLLVVGGSKIPVGDTGLVKNASLRDMLGDAAMDTRGLVVAKDKILQRQLQQHIEVMASVVEHHPKKASQMYDAIKKYASHLNAFQKSELLEAIRKEVGKDIADSIAVLFHGSANDPVLLLKKLLKSILPEDELNQVLKSMDDGNFEDLPLKARKIRKDLFEMTAYRRTNLAGVSGEDLLKKFQKELNLKSMNTNTRDTLTELVLSLDQSNDALVYKKVLGEDLGISFAKVKEYMPDKVKVSLAKKLSPRVSLKTLHDKWTVLQKKHISTEFGDSRVGLGADAVIGLAMTFYEINQIMEKKGLKPEEESRQLTNAVVSNMPVVGDIFMSMNTGYEAYWEGSYSKGAMSAAYVVIGIGGMVPGFQLPALVAGLGMGGAALGTVAWDLSTQKDIIWAWVASGDWKAYESNGVFKSGKMAGLIDAKAKSHTFGAKSSRKAEAEFLLEQFITQGDVYYHAPFRLSSHTSGLPGKTIRESIYDFSELTILKSVKKFGLLKQALLTQYPDFDVDKQLRKPLNEGRTALLGYLKEEKVVILTNKKGKPKNVAFKLYENLKVEYDMAAVEAVKALRHEAEAEYQAAFNYGEAKATLEKLQELEVEYRLPFTKHVDAITDEVHKYFFELLKSPLEKHSIPRRRIDLARKYVEAYDGDIRAGIQRIRAKFELANVSPPSKINPYNLSGYVEPDLERIAKLEIAYGRAIKLAKDDVAKLLAKSMPGMPFKLSNPCVNKLFKKLASIRMRLVRANDLRLIAEEWAGRTQAATEERDAIFQKMDIRKSAGRDNVLTIPEVQWMQGARAVEKVHIQQNMAVNWDDRVWTFGAERQYLEAAKQIRERMDDLTEEYNSELQLGGLEISACLSKLTVQLVMRSSAGGQDRPISGGTVTLQIPFRGALSLLETSPGTYQVNAPEAGTFQITASHASYKGEDGSPFVKRKIVQPEPQKGQVPPPMVETIYMAPANQPTLSPTFIPAQTDQPPTLALTLSSSLRPLNPKTLKLRIGQQPAENPELRVSEDGMSLYILHFFVRTSVPGSTAVHVDIEDMDGISFTVSGSFDYIPALQLAVSAVDDSDGMFVNQQVNAGEKFKLSLQLKSFEPGPVTDIQLIYIPGTQHLHAAGNIVWSLPGITPMKAMDSPWFEYQADAKISQPENLQLAFDVIVGGIKLTNPLQLTLPVLPSAQYVIDYLRVDDSKALFATNNEDGRAHAGEQFEIRFSVKNDSTVSLSSFTLSGSSPSPWMTIGAPQQAHSLSPGQEIILALPARVSRDLKEITTVDLIVAVNPDSGAQPLLRTFPITLYPPPLAIRLQGIDVHDPDSGELASRNNNNGRLGHGEHAFIDVNLHNDGPDLEDVVIDLISLHSMVTIEKKIAQGEGVRMPSGELITQRFEIKMPVDYPANTLGLRVKVVPSSLRNLWQTETSLPVEEKLLLEGTLVLSPADPAALQPGSDLRYTLTLQSKAARKLDNLIIGLWSSDVNLEPPTEFYKQSFTPGQVHTYSGKLHIPASISVPQFTISIDSFNESGSRKIFQKRVAFDLGMLATQISVKPVLLDENGTQWKLLVSVIDGQGHPVNAGFLALTVSHGTLSATQVPVQNGQAELVWTRAEDISGQALVEIDYLGYSPETGKTGNRYSSSHKSVFVPPEFKSRLKVVVWGSDSDNAIEIFVKGIPDKRTGPVAIFEGLAPGTYQVTATAPGCESAHSSVDIDPTAPGSVVEVNLHLKQTPQTDQDDVKQDGDGQSQHSGPCFRGYEECMFVWQGKDQCLKQCQERFDACKLEYEKYTILKAKYEKCQQSIVHCDVPESIYFGIPGTADEYLAICNANQHAGEKSCNGDTECLNRNKNQFADCKQKYHKYIEFKSSCAEDYEAFCEGDPSELYVKLTAANNRYIPFATGNMQCDDNDDNDDENTEPMSQEEAIIQSIEVVQKELGWPIREVGAMLMRNHKGLYYSINDVDPKGGVWEVGTENWIRINVYNTVDDANYMMSHEWQNRKEFIQKFANESGAGYFYDLRDGDKHTTKIMFQVGHFIISTVDRGPKAKEYFNIIFRNAMSRGVFEQN